MNGFMESKLISAFASVVAWVEGLRRRMSDTERQIGSLSKSLLRENFGKDAMARYERL